MACTMFGNKFISAYDPKKCTPRPKKSKYWEYKDGVIWDCFDLYDIPKKRLEETKDNFRGLYWIDEDATQSIEIKLNEIKVDLTQYRSAMDYSFIFEGRVQIRIPEDNLSPEVFKETMRQMVEEFKKTIKKEFVEFSAMDLEDL